MNEKEEIKAEVINFLETFHIHIGKKININEALCTNRDSFNRHFTTYSSTEFELREFSARVSGARIMFIGETLHYEISIDRIIKFDKSVDNFIFIEKYSEEIYRKTIVSLDQKI